MSEKYVFKFLGNSPMYTLRAAAWNTEDRNSFDSYALQNEVFNWLFENCRGKYILSNGSDTDSNIPAFLDGKSICLLFEKKTDLEKFSYIYPVRNLPCDFFS